MVIKIIENKNPISQKELTVMTQECFGDLIKAVVDVEKEIMAVGGELHADEEALLLEMGSEQKNLWGINLYPDKSGEEMIEFDSMINLRPSCGNRSCGVENSEIREKIREIVKKLISS